MTTKTDPNPQKPTPQEWFLAFYAETGRFWSSAESAGVSGREVEQWAEDDPDFAERMREARELYTDTLVAEAHRRAMVGGPRSSSAPSDKLLIALIQQARKDFGAPPPPPKVDVNVNNAAGVLLVGGTAGSLEEWRSKEAELLERRKEGLERLPEAGAEAIEGPAPEKPPQRRPAAKKAKGPRRKGPQRR